MDSQPSVLSPHVRGDPMKKALFGLAFIGALVGGAVVLNMGEIPPSELRPARMPCDKIVKEDCPAGVIQSKDFCLCLTNKETLPDEESTVPVGKRVRMEVCQVEDELSKQKHLATRYVPSALPLDGNCTLILDDIRFPAISFHNVPTGIEARLEVVCAPCKITPDSWGHCPECFYRGDCATLCPEVEDGL